MATEKLMADFKKGLESPHKQPHHKGNLIITNGYRSKARKEKTISMKCYRESEERNRERCCGKKNVWEAG